MPSPQVNVFSLLHQVLSSFVIRRSLTTRRLGSLIRLGGRRHGLALLLRVQHGLQLWRGLEAGMVRVLLVKVVFGLGPQLRGEFFEDGLQEAIDGFLLGALTVPDGDEVRVEADRETYAAELVACEAEKKGGECQSQVQINIEQDGAVHTILQHALELLSNGQQLHAGPKVRADALGHTEGPAAAVDVAAVLPDGAEARLEEVDGLAHLDLLDGGVVVVAPKVLHRLDLRAELLQLGLVAAVVGLLLVLCLPGGGRGPQSAWDAQDGWAPRSVYVREFHLDSLPVKVDIPVVLRRQRAHGLEKVALGVVARLGWRAYIRRVGVGALRQAREPAGEERRSRRSHFLRLVVLRVAEL